VGSRGGGRKESEAESRIRAEEMAEPELRAPSEELAELELRLASGALAAAMSRGMGLMAGV